MQGSLHRLAASDQEVVRGQIPVPFSDHRTLEIQIEAHDGRDELKVLAATEARDHADPGPRTSLAKDGIVVATLVVGRKNGIGVSLQEDLEGKTRQSVWQQSIRKPE
jgi:hypothetical protein